MTLKDFYSKALNLPKEVQKAASRAMLYAGFAMQSTNNKMLSHSAKDYAEAGLVISLGSHTLMGQLKSGVNSNQTKKFEESYLRIMDNAPLVQMDYKPVVDKDGEVVSFDAVPRRGLELTPQELADKLYTELESKTDKSDNLPIEYGLKVKRLLTNEMDLIDDPNAKKEFISNFYIEYGQFKSADDFIYQYPLEEMTEMIHVKTIDKEKKLIELYTSMGQFCEAYFYYQGEELINYLKSSITHLTLIRRTHRDDEIFVYEVSNMREIKKVNGKFLIKFEATSVI